MPAVVEALRQMPEVRSLQSVSGIWDLAATGVVPTIGDMDALTDRIGAVARSEARRTGNECVSPCRSRWSLEPSQKTNNAYTTLINTTPPLIPTTIVN